MKRWSQTTRLRLRSKRTSRGAWSFVSWLRQPISLAWPTSSMSQIGVPSRLRRTIQRLAVESTRSSSVTPQVDNCASAFANRILPERGHSSISRRMKRHEEHSNCNSRTDWIVIFMVAGWPVVGSGRCGRVPGVGVTTATSAAGGGAFTSGLSKRCLEQVADLVAGERDQRHPARLGVGKWAAEAEALSQRISRSRSAERAGRVGGFR